jgi:ABC-2 type transport system permease protein
VWGTLHSEWGKTWSVRAPLACLIGTGALVLLTAASLANDTMVSIRSGDLPVGTTVPAVDAVGPAVQFGQLAFGAFALQLITAEYATGLIRSTLQVPPGWNCAYYTDGNFPLAMATFEVCDDGSRITRTTDLSKEPLP